MASHINGPCVLVDQIDGRLYHRVLLKLQMVNIQHAFEPPTLQTFERFMSVAYALYSINLRSEQP